MTFDRIYVLFPDPWPKKRHHERRILQHDFILALVRLLKVNGELCIASDDAAYIHHVLVLMQGVPALRWTATRQADWQTPFTPEVTTAFHRKAMQAGRACIFLRFALEG
jgi:tRNA (guanine-N7-)-methyltransferase